MSRKIYFFGDSFTVDYETDWTWTRQLAEKLHVDGLVNHSMVGTSNDWILMKLRECIPTLTANDVVVVVTTSLYRHWFIKDFPELSNYMIGNWSQMATKEHIDQDVIDSVQGYAVNLQRNDIDQFRFETQVAWLKGVQTTVGCSLLLIPGFEMPIDFKGLVRVHGDMTNTLSNNEFVTLEQRDLWYQRGIDTRYNHMIRDNHDLLSDKCVNSILTGNDLDLTDGFKIHQLHSDDKATHKQIGPKLVELNKQLYGS